MIWIALVVLVVMVWALGRMQTRRRARFEAEAADDPGRLHHGHHGGQSGHHGSSGGSHHGGGSSGGGGGHHG
jgi:uncharacterized membrane protein YgcG